MLEPELELELELEPMSTVLVHTAWSDWLHVHPEDLIGRTIIGHSAVWNGSGAPFWSLETKPTAGDREDEWVEAPHGNFWDGDLLLPLLDEAIRKPRALIVDVGAYIGHSAVYAGNHGVPVLAIEPNPGAFELLVQNVAANDLHGLVYPLRTAAYDRECRMVLAPEQDQGQAIPLRPDGWPDLAQVGNGGGLAFIPTNGDGVSAVALDSLVPMFTLGLDVALIKVDSQGCDLRVLRGLKRTIREYKPVVCFEWEEELAARHGDKLEDALNLLDGWGYEVSESTALPRNFVGRPK